MNLEGHEFATHGFHSLIIRELSKAQMLGLMLKCAESVLCPKGLKAGGGTQAIELLGLAATVPRLGET